MLALVFAMCAAAQVSTDPNAARDAKLIAAVKAVPIQKLDPLLPDEPFERWLRAQSGRDAQFHWEVNDCGEQTGTPGDSGPIPLCVEVDSALKDGRQIVIFIANDQPSNDGPPEWKIFFAQLTTSHEKINLRRLSDLPAALIKTHQLTHHPETAK